MIDEAASDRSTDAPQIRLAIVDDHSVTAEGPRRIFAAEQDVQVVGTAGDIAAAIRLIEEATPDVVLMDFALPDGTATGPPNGYLHGGPE